MMWPPKSRTPACPTSGKRAYRKREDALDFALKLTNRHPNDPDAIQKPYDCPECMYWHLTRVKRPSMTSGGKPKHLE